MKSISVPIRGFYQDDRSKLPSKCRECIWRTGRVCAFASCVKRDHSFLK